MMVSSRQESILPPLKTEQFTQNIQLRTIQEASAAPRPLVLLFGWMLAKQRHLDKYGNMYHSKGFDVLSLQVTIFVSVTGESSFFFCHGIFMFGSFVISLQQETGGDNYNHDGDLEN